eukprot:CAMPEP_0185266600 /NCGR_PEP_ID=MMETSP1359-20130426/31565_1 /TAXON_ID=552665 /ORGANISM="Bigelowiella longifila, Strain CCMP242" /LENGTH=45 /DNA_ID= /DNA_START= /DNA_END= /DNA_ORIENTATION=
MSYLNRPTQPPTFSPTQSPTFSPTQSPTMTLDYKLENIPQWLKEK